MITSPEERSRVIDYLVGKLRAEPRCERKAGVRYCASFPYCTIEVSLDEELPAVGIADHTGFGGAAGDSLRQGRLYYRGDADGLLAVDLEEPNGPDANGVFAGPSTQLLRGVDGQGRWALTVEDRARFDAFLLYSQRELGR